jgi:glycosyltransferase involved in cell wall biosynthesis
MKVTHLSKSDIQGGAARAAYRIHVGLGQIGVDSKMLVDDKIGYDPAVHAPEGIISKAWTMVRPSVNNIPLKFYDWQKTPFYTAWIGRNPAAHYLLKQSDIIHLHWIAGGLVSIKDISRLAKLGKPIVWTLPDMWAFTGGCHYAGNCEKYIDSCGKCPQLGSNRSNDITRKIWKRKRRAYANLNLTIVAPSRWLAECARRSSLLCDSKIETIPFGLNTDIFKPINKLLAREEDYSFRSSE